MSDGFGDCARSALHEAKKLAREKYPDAQMVMTYMSEGGCGPGRSIYKPQTGKVVIIYEDWIEHVLEYYEDGKLIHRLRVPPSGEYTEEK